MKLYLLDRVIEAEESDDFVKHVSDPKRKDAAKRAMDTKIKNLINWTQTVVIEYNFPDSNDLYGDVRKKVNYLRVTLLET